MDDALLQVFLCFMGLDPFIEAAMLRYPDDDLGRVLLEVLRFILNVWLLELAFS